MNTTFEKYLDTIDKCLKPLPTSERVDIVKRNKRLYFRNGKRKSLNRTNFNQIRKAKRPCKSLSWRFTCKGKRF